jgi:hypothetical protein
MGGHPARGLSSGREFTAIANSPGKAFPDSAAPLIEKIPAFHKNWPDDCSFLQYPSRPPL